jgi:pectin methylesterase-like acyl-CoA thioesterase
VKEPSRASCCIRCVRGRLLLLSLVVATLGATSSSDRSRSDIAVPGDVPTLQLAIAQAQPGDRIVLSAGTYPGGNVVPRERHDITIVGADRNAVVLDGADRRKNGILVRADGVTILNMSAHNFLENAFYWNGANRFRASYLTAWNVRGYGIYAEGGRQGTLDHDYV